MSGTFVVQSDGSRDRLEITSRPKGQIVYGYLRPYLNKVWVAELDGYSSVDQFAFGVRPELLLMPIEDVDRQIEFLADDSHLARQSSNRS
jgi:hypothetical protein